MLAPILPRPTMPSCMARRVAFSHRRLEKRSFMTTERFNVPEVSCGHCKSTIEAALLPHNGIEQAEVDVDGKTVRVSFDDAVVDRTTVV
ncbi:MAG: heavy-metal-associated domain-containing protein, partial [Actinomycetota bacterium]